MTKTIALALSSTLALAVPAAAADSWGLEFEKEVKIEGKVVDLLCEIAKDCPPDCGAGTRQMGLVGTDGRLYPAAKAAVNFAGAVADLAPLCGQTVTVDGLLIENPRMPMLFVQYVKAPGAADFAPADAFDAAWSAKNGTADEWYRADPLVKDVIAADGVFGIKGLEPTP